PKAGNQGRPGGQLPRRGGRSEPGVAQRTPGTNPGNPGRPPPMISPGGVGDQSPGSRSAPREPQRPLPDHLPRRGSINITPRRYNPSGAKTDTVCRPVSRGALRDPGHSYPTPPAWLPGSRNPNAGPDTHT